MVFFSLFFFVRVYVHYDYPDGPPEQELGVNGVTPPEDQRGRGKRCGGLRRHVGSGVVLVYLENTPRRVHVFWSLPAGMVLVRISHLIYKTQTN